MSQKKVSLVEPGWMITREITVGAIRVDTVVNVFHLEAIRTISSGVEVYIFCSPDYSADILIEAFGSRGMRGTTENFCDIVPLSLTMGDDKRNGMN